MLVARWQRGLTSHAVYALGVRRSGATCRMTADPYTIAGSVVTATITAVIGAITVLSNWHAYRQALTDHGQEIARDSALVRFWEDWLRVRLLTADADEKVAARKRVSEELEALAKSSKLEADLERSRGPNRVA